MNVTINKRKITALLVVIGFLTVFSLTNAVGNVLFAPPSEGTWTITTDETITGETLIINVAIDITADGSLTITDSTLTFNVTETNGINIQVSGALTIVNSVITVLNTSVMLPVTLLSASSLTITNSTLEYVNLYGEELTVSIDEATFSYCELSFKNDISFAVTNTVFQHTTSALTLENVTGTFAHNNFVDVENGLHVKKTKPGHVIISYVNFYNVSDVGILLESSSSVTVEHGLFSNVSTGISSLGTAVLIDYNTFDVVNTGISLEKGVSSANIGNNTFTNANLGIYGTASKGILISNNDISNSVTGIQLVGASATI
ncbi:MAG: right-handed parallel beta-helix repeat-containing protein, partial [Candidatus Heimdallarchaeaceae archaeon]